MLVVFARIRGRSRSHVALESGLHLAHEIIRNERRRPTAADEWYLPIVRKAAGGKAPWRETGRAGCAPMESVAPDPTA